MPQLRFQRSDYIVSEEKGTVDVCVELIVGGAPNILAATALVLSQSGTAQGKHDVSCVYHFILPSYSAYRNKRYKVHTKSGRVKAMT